MLILYELTRGRGDRNLMHLLIGSINIHCCKHKQTVRITLRNFNKVEILIRNSEVLRCSVAYDQQMTLQSSTQSYPTETELIARESEKTALRHRRKSEHGNIPTILKSGIKLILATSIKGFVGATKWYNTQKLQQAMRTLLPCAWLINKWKDHFIRLTRLIGL